VRARRGDIACGRVGKYGFELSLHHQEFELSAPMFLCVTC